MEEVKKATLLGRARSTDRCPEGRPPGPRLEGKGNKGEYFLRYRGAGIRRVRKREKKSRPCQYYGKKTHDRDVEVGMGRATSCCQNLLVGGTS